MKRTGAGDFLSVTQADLPPFRLARPRTIDEALEALAAAPAPAVIHAGGTDLFSRFCEGLKPAALIHIGGVEALRSVDLANGFLRLGAGIRHRDAVAHPALEAAPGLREAWAKIATTRIRAVATLGGNLMARHARYELSILLSALGAEAQLAGPGGATRRLPVEALWDEDLGDTPLLLAVSIPLAGRPRLDYERSQRPRFTQAVALRGGAVRFALATEYRRPWVADAQAGAHPEEILARMPADFGDLAVSRAHIARAGSVFLGRQLARLEAFA